MSDVTDGPATIPDVPTEPEGTVEPEGSVKSDGAAPPDGPAQIAEASPPRVHRNRWLIWPVPTLVVILLVLAGTGFWYYSPWEHLSGAKGTPPPTPSGAPASGTRRGPDVTDPVLVAGVVLTRHGNAVRAIDLAHDTTWWTLSRPGRVKVDSIGRVDGRHAAIVWTDGRLTVVEVPTGNRVHVDLPDFAVPSDKHDPWNPTAPTVGLSDPSGHPFVAVVQSRRVDTYDASSGRLVWSRSAPDNCGFDEPYAAQQHEGAFLSLDVVCKLDPNDDHYDDYGRVTYSMLLDASFGRPLPHFDHFAFGSLVPVGDHELLQNVVEGVTDTGYRVVDSGTGSVLWKVDQSALHGGFTQVSGGDGMVVVSDTTAARIMVYRAADGKRLWQYAVTGGAFMPSPAQVIAGQVRLIQEVRGQHKVLTFDSTGKVVGTQNLAMFDRGGNPVLIEGDYATLVVEDSTTEMNYYPDPPYVLLTAAG